MVSLLRGANVLDVVQREVEYDDLDETGHRRRNHLGHEHGAGWDLHVMTKFQVGDETEGLGHGDVPESLETEQEGCEMLAYDCSDGERVRARVMK